MRLAMFATVIACAFLACVSTARAAKGEWSIGGNFGKGFYSGGSFNDSLKAIGYKKVSSGWEYGGSIRYGVSPKLSLDYEVLSINGKGTTKSVTPKFQAEVNGIATPLSIYYALSASPKSSVSLFVGAGPMLKTSWSVAQDTVEVESRTKTTFYAHAGLEGLLRVGPHFGVSARAMGRMAKAKGVEELDDPTTKFDVSMNGFAVGVGLRAFFGGGSY